MLQHRTGHFVPSALAAKRPDSASRWFNDKGELNASDNVDALKTLGSLLREVTAGNISMRKPQGLETAGAQELATFRRERNEHLIQAFHDRSGGSWAETGAAIGAELSEVAMRDGFMRRFLVRADLANGQLARIRVKIANVTCVVAASATQVVASFARQKYIYPPEFYINGNVRIENRDIAQGTSDLLEELFLRAQEQIMVTEDRLYKAQLDATVGVANAQQILAGGLTPSSLAAMREQIITWGLGAVNMLQAADVWTDIVGNAQSWGHLFDPVTQFEIIQTGYLGTLLGLGITTDAYREPLQKVLNPGEIYITSSSDTHGAYTDRGPVQAVPQDQYADGVPARGWYLTEMMSMTVVNARSVVKGIRA